MVKIENHMGTIEISHGYFTNLIGHAVSECYGVSGMAVSTPSQGLRSLLLGRDAQDKGVTVRNSGDQLAIDLHIVVSYGVNIAAIVKSIRNKVRYTIESATGLTVVKVNVYVDSMKADGEKA